MKLFICHYHLKPGGVTRIIQSQIKAIRNSNLFDEIVILTGEDPGLVELKTSEFNGVRIIKKSLFNYMESFTSEENCKEKYKLLMEFFKETINHNDILHIHNPALGKNPVVTYGIYNLAKAGYKLFLHCHDFAEDRPDNIDSIHQVIQDYFSVDIDEVMYPDFPNCFFGVINSFDLNRIMEMNISREQIFFLPNPVIAPGPVKQNEKENYRKRILKTFSISKDLPIMLYPVRVIKRKNFGEFILLALLFMNKAHWFVTLAPQNPLEKGAYNEWKKLAIELDIPIIFEAGNKAGFNELMNAADKIITTSIQEGFGMAFLESWLYNKAVVGRSLPNIVSDFEKEGLKYPLLYDYINISLNDIDLDFPELSVEEQMDFIRKIRNDENKIKRIISNSGLEDLLFCSVSSELLAHNKGIIKSKYSKEAYAEKLERIYSLFSKKT